MMTEIIEDFYERYSYGQGPFLVKITISDNMGGDDEFYVFSQDFDQVKERIRGLFSRDKRYNPSYEDYAIRLVKFMYETPPPGPDEVDAFYKYLRTDYVHKSTNLMEKKQDPKEWKKAQDRFDSAMKRHLDRIHETVLIIGD